MKELLFGTAGIPLSTPKPGTVEGITHVKTLGLSAMELEFVHSVNISEEKAPLVKKAAQENEVVLTCHGQYFINLNAREAEKVKASQQRIFRAAHVADLCGAYSLCFHPAFYLNMPPAQVYATVKKNLEKVVQEVKAGGHKIWVRTETTGKGAQFGTLEELLQLSQELDQVMPCIDFSHLHARSNGKFNSYPEFCGILEQVEKALGKKGLQEMHIHVSGIAYSEKGEKNHLVLKESDLEYGELMKALREFKCAGVVICESPNLEGDALLLQKAFREC